MEKAITKMDIPGVRLFSRGKVREVYELDERLLIVTTDRISAFDSVLPNGIPCKGKVLNALSAHWFELTGDIIDNHLITIDAAHFPPEVKGYEASLRGRSMLAKKTKQILVECVVRGFLAGSGWLEYCEAGSISGVSLPEGLLQGERLPHPIFTPATKAASGHDVNITREKVNELIGEEKGQMLEDVSLRIYERACEIAESRGIIIADTKFEFGLDGNKLILIDELLTPDSSRFWPKEDYRPGRPQPSFDKQFVRDYLERIGWDKNPPAPELPDDVVKKTTEKYIEAYRRITGKEFVG